ncbi:MAG: Phenylpropionate dioxygenase-related ring-hydroxylating dioxygenase, large terminal subunit [Actinomycetia bacterium]|nr:Phenylpropionate dioxygenase-related ring-hydroxylating dioxygenase, large terminal subunit [Actinomycetes bacterium]
MRLPAANRLVIPVDLDCNYVQPLEGLADSSHVGMLHQDTLGTREAPNVVALTTVDAPVLEVESTDFGMHLVPADQAVIRMRRILLESVKRVSMGEPPIGVKTSTNVSEVRAGSGFVQPGDDWHDFVPGHVVVDRAR